MSVEATTVRAGNTSQRISELETALQELAVIGTDLRQLRAIVQRLDAIEQRYLGIVERSEREFTKLVEETAASREQLTEQARTLAGDYEIRVTTLDARAERAARQAEEWTLA